MKIAVLLTTRNRKAKTLTCLESLKRQQLSGDMQIDIFLTDDGSTDGTAEAVKQFYPLAHVFNSDGSLFWAGGMRNSWRNALKHNPDYYLLLNDDTTLLENTITILLKGCKDHNSRPAVCIGSTADPETGKRSYGGRKLTSKRSWRDDQVIFSDTEYLACDVANANIMMVPAEVVKKVGILSDSYTHGLADYDYTLKVNKGGFKVLVAPGYLGTCVNDHGHNWKSHKTSLSERIQYLKSPKGLAYREYMIFIKKHFPLSYPSAFIKVWMKTFFPFIWEAYRK